MDAEPVVKRALERSVVASLVVVALLALFPPTRRVGAAFAVAWLVFAHPAAWLCSRWERDRPSPKELRYDPLSRA
jgi:hypothetical protein